MLSIEKKIVIAGWARRHMILKNRDLYLQSTQIGEDIYIALGNTDNRSSFSKQYQKWVKNPELNFDATAKSRLLKALEEQEFNIKFQITKFVSKNHEDQDD